MYIDKMLEEDVPSVCAIAASCFSRPWTEKAFLEEIENPRAHCLVARENGEVIGYLSFWMILDEAQINSFALIKTYRGRGIGSQMMQKAIEFAKQKHVNTMTLEVRLSNERAQKLYKKFGFLEVGIRPQFYEKPTEDALLMTKNFSEVHYL